MINAERRALPRGAGPALLALAACLVCYAAGWRGTDWAAQLYRVSQAAQHGLVVWDAGWYGGTFPLNYSVVYPMAAAFLGLWPLAALSAAGAAWSFDRLVSAGLGPAPAASWYFAVSTVVEVAIGQLPTLAGEALALGCLVLLGPLLGPERRPDARGQEGSGADRVGARAAGRPHQPRSRVFPGPLPVRLGWLGGREGTGPGGPGQGGGRRPCFRRHRRSSSGFPLTRVFPVRARRPVRGAGHLRRTGRPLARRRPPRAGGRRPLRGGQRGPVLRPHADGRQRRPLRGLYRCPAGDLLPASGGGAPRLEPAWPRAGTGPPGGRGGCRVPGLVALVPHYRSRRRASRWSLERGLFLPAAPGRAGCPDQRQPGPGRDPAYRSPLGVGVRSRRVPARPGLGTTTGHGLRPTFLPPRAVPAGAYRAWLVSNGVSYVALADSPLDYAAAGEAALLRSGTVPGLVPVWQLGPWKVWEVEGSSGLATSPARVTSLRPGGVALRFSTAGSSVVKVRWSPYWSLGAAAGRAACIQRSVGGWTEVSSAAPAVLELTISVLGAHHGECSAPMGPPGPTIREWTADEKWLRDLPESARSPPTGRRSGR